MKQKIIKIKPQAGPQETFLSTSADIALYGGAAGGGKTFALLFEPIRHIRNQNFGAVIFRRESPQITNEGGLWDESIKLYPSLGAEPLSHKLTHKFPSGAKLKFSHLQYDSDVLNWQGSQIPFLGFDELTHFSKSQFFYMMSRNRSTCGVRPYIRATTNPDADSWVAEFIAWWIDQDTGLAIPERSGVIRWFINLNNEIIWADTKKELQDKYEGCMPKSFTFIVASIYDNKILLKKDPGYLANLMALPLVDRERLLGGNWKIRPSSGLYFKREYFQIVDAAPSDCEWWRSWDLAATEKTHDNDPDWTVGVKIGRDKQGVFYIGDVIRFQKSPLHVEQAILNIAEQDGSRVRIALSQDPGQAGKAQAEYLTRKLAGYMVFTERETGDKVTRAGAFSAQCEAGNVKIVRAAWNSTYLMELENFPPEKNKGHDDQVDASANGFNRIAKPAQQVRIRTA